MKLFRVVGAASLLIFMTSPMVVATDMDILLNADRLSGASRGKKTPEQQLEEMQAYFLETVFLKPFVENDQSIFTDEERQQMGDDTSREMQQSLMTRTFAQRLAKQDLLGFKKIYLKPSLIDSSSKPDVPHSTSVAPYVFGTLLD